MAHIEHHRLFFLSNTFFTQDTRLSSLILPPRLDQATSYDILRTNFFFYRVFFLVPTATNLIVYVYYLVLLLFKIASAHGGAAGL